MPYNVIEFESEKYPEFQTKGFASKYIFPFAEEVLKGKGLDIGCSKKEWAFPGSMPIDLIFDDEWHAMNLPNKKFDYIFSSHCLEHLNDWVRVLDYWSTKIKTNGVLFLYLPHYSQKYWRPWNNNKHINVLTSEILRDYLEANNWNKILISGKDLYNSFAVCAEKGHISFYD